MIINSLWIGEELTAVEWLSIASHLQQGHEYHLWTYQDLAVPKGVILEDGNAILPASNIFCYSGPKETGGGSVSAFSNVFRYKLLSEREGWWCDTDVVCLKPFSFESHAYATEQLEDGTVVPTTCVMHIPRDVAAFCYRTAVNRGRSVRWGEIGPALFALGVQGIPEFAKDPTVFCPIHWWNYRVLFEERQAPESYAIHLWNEMWRRDGVDKNGTFGPNSLFECLKRKMRGPQLRVL